MQKSIELFSTQGYNDVYFTAQFMRGKQKQNGIERGDLSSFANQIRTYVHSEDADSVRIEFFDESSGKSVYSKVLSGLNSSDSADSKQTNKSTGSLGGFNGLGEAEFDALVDKRVDVKERAKDFERQGKELDELRTRFATLVSEKEEVEAELKAKKNLEFYSGIIGTVFPGIAPLFNGTPLAQAAGFLAGTGDVPESANEDVQSVSAMITEFCNTLTTQEASAMHLLCAAFEADRSKIQSTLQQVMAGSPATKTPSS